MLGGYVFKGLEVSKGVFQLGCRGWWFGRFLLGGAGGRRVLSALVVSRCFLFSFVWVVGWDCAFVLVSFALRLGAQGLLGVGLLLVASLVGSWGVALGGAGGWSGWQGWVLGIWLRMRVASKDNGFHFFVVAFYNSMLFGRQCDSGYIIVALPISLPLRIWPSSINLVAAGLLTGLDPSGYMVALYCFKLRAFVGDFEEYRLIPCLNRDSSFPVCVRWALPRGFIFIACYSLALGENAVKATDVVPLLKQVAADPHCWLCIGCCHAHFLPSLRSHLYWMFTQRPLRLMCCYMSLPSCSDLDVTMPISTKSEVPSLKDVSSTSSTLHMLEMSFF
ncbi:hypothetical protein U1Q18_006896 [Sarracenia purpurea var. burkii]